MFTHSQGGPCLCCQTLLLPGVGVGGRGAREALEGECGAPSDPQDSSEGIEPITL